MKKNFKTYVIYVLNQKSPEVSSKLNFNKYDPFPAHPIYPSSPKINGPK